MARMDNPAWKRVAAAETEEGAASLRQAKVEMVAKGEVVA